MITYKLACLYQYLLSLIDNKMMQFISNCDDSIVNAFSM